MLHLKVVCISASWTDWRHFWVLQMPGGSLLSDPNTLRPKTFRRLVDIDDWLRSAPNEWYVEWPSNIVPD